MRIVILGAGLAGLSAAYHLNKLGVDCILVEKEKNVGGLCSTYRSRDGFVFDKTLHLFHTRTKYAERLICDMLKNNVVRHKRIAKVFIEGDLVPYPFQSYFYLTKNRSLVRECTIGLEELSEKRFNKPVQNFEDYVYRKFGKGIAKRFMIPYNEKLWTISPKELSYDWARRFVPAPDPSEILRMLKQYRRLKSPEIKEWGYNPEFLYFKEGGIQNIADSLWRNLSRTTTKLSCEVIEADLKKKRIKLSNQEQLDYDLVVSTIPLPELVEIARNPPSLVESAKGKLRHTSIYNINLGFKKQLLKGTHWIYIADPSVSFLD